MNDLGPAIIVEEAFRGNDINAELVLLDDAASLTYLTAFPDVEPDHDEMGRTVTPLLEHARNDELELRIVKATVLRGEGDAQATWALEADWTRAYSDYALDDEELFQRVLDSLYEEGDA